MSGIFDSTGHLRDDSRNFYISTEDTEYYNWICIEKNIKFNFKIYRRRFVALFIYAIIVDN